MIVSLVAALALAPPTAKWEFEIDAVKRTALVYPGTNPNGNVVIVFHGHGGNGNQVSRSWGLHPLMPDTTFVYPDGLPTKVPRVDPDGRFPGWQVAEGQEGDRDLKFVEAMMTKIGNRPVAIAGHSNGAAMTMLLWRKYGKRFKGYVEIAGAMGIVPPKFDETPIFCIAGRQDTLVPYAQQERFINALGNAYHLTDKPKEGFLMRGTNANHTPFWTYMHDGGHPVPQAARPAMVEFLKLAFSR
jgi:polyhydroxybutyrate depolymerase